MALEIEFEYRGQRFVQAAKGLEAFAKGLDVSIEGQGAILRKELRDYLDQVAESLSRRHSTPWPNGTTTSPAPGTLSRRSGGLMRRVKDSVDVKGELTSEIVGTIGGGMIAGVHEHGATIRARRSKYLTIPLKAALDNRGVPIKRSAREWDNTFVQMSRKGNLIIFQKRGRQIVPLYVLKREVVIPARLGLGLTLRAGLPYFTDRAIDALLKGVRGEARL